MVLVVVRSAKQGSWELRVYKEQDQGPTRCLGHKMSAGAGSQSHPGVPRVTPPLCMVPVHGNLEPKDGLFLKFRTLSTSLPSACSQPWKEAFALRDLRYAVLLRPELRRG